MIRGLPGVEFDGTQVINSDHALGFKKVPASLIVLGAGAVGVEFASIFATFGAKVTIVELLPRLIPIEDGLSRRRAGAGVQEARARRCTPGTKVEKVVVARRTA